MSNTTAGLMSAAWAARANNPIASVAGSFVPMQGFMAGPRPSLGAAGNIACETGSLLFSPLPGGERSDCADRRDPGEGVTAVENILGAVTPSPQPSPPSGRGSPPSPRI